MSEFRIFETEEFQKKLGKLPAGASRFVERKLTEYVYPQLRKDPFLGRTDSFVSPAAANRSTTTATTTDYEEKSPNRPP